jgi:hypothetical protein
MSDTVFNVYNANKFTFMYQNTCASLRPYERRELRLIFKTLLENSYKFGEHNKFVSHSMS